MPDLLVSVELAVGILLGLGLGFIALVFLRRRTIARGRVLTMCGLRQASTGWRMGLVRYGVGQLEWYALGGLTIRPKYRWEQRVLELGSPAPASLGEGLDVLSDPVAVTCRYQGSTFQLALSEAAYTALRSWLEAAPPGAASTVT
ncbi:MAG: DUF2550 domain-containing protein [Dermatophilaceae bacterium]